MNASGFCPRCGTPLNPGARFCMKCGNDVSGEQAAPATVRVATPPPTVDPWVELQQKLVRATVGEYEIQGEIGRGGMASVYLAHDIALDRKVAIKVMSPDLFRDAAMADRFKREARTAASLSHPHIIHIYAVKQQADILYFVMELIRGRPLDVLLRESGPMPLPMAQYLLAQIGGALGYAHRRGIVHRDVKPANVMVDEEGKAIVTDFGIAKVAEAKGLTMTGATIGTPAYMSPEQCNAREVTGASDQYSMGIMAFEMLAGRTPFQADTLMGIMYQHFNEVPPPLASFRPDLPSPVLAAVSRMLGKKSEDRYPRIEDAVQALGNLTLAHDNPDLLQLIRWVEADPQRHRFATPTPPRSPVPGGRPSAAATTPAPPSGSGAPRPSVATAVAELTVDPATVELRVGETATVRAYPRDGAGGTLTGRRVEWSTSGPAVATVDAQGRVTAGAEGRATLTATCEAHSAVVHVTVLPVPVVGIVIAPAGGRVVAGETLRLVASVQGAAGASLVGRRVTWSSNAPASASIDAHGVVSGLAPGLATITARSDEISSVVQVTVLPQPVSAVRLDDPLGGRPLNVGQSVRLRAIPLDAAGQPLSDREVSWMSSAPATLEISAEGVATAIAPGRVKVSANCEGIRSALDIVVPVPAIEAGEVTAKVKGVEVPLAAVPPRPRPPRPTPRPARSKRPLVIGGAIVTILAVVGAFLIFRPKASAGGGPTEGPAPTSTAPARPADTKVASLYILPGTAALAVGDSLAAHVVARNAEDSQLVVGSSVRWTSSDPAVARVSPGGSVKVLKGGRTTITADYADQTASLAITGTATRASVASVTPQAPSAPLWIGDTLTIGAEVKDQAGAVLGGRTMNWTSSDPKVARIGADGRLTAVAAGRATLTATSEGKRGILVVSVTTVPTGAVILDPAAAHLDVGQTRTVRARVTDPRGRPLDRPVNWRSTATTVVSVSPAGVVKGEGAGTATVIAEVDGKRSEVAVTVAAPVAAVVAAPLKEMPVLTRPNPASTEAAAPPAATPTGAPPTAQAASPTTTATSAPAPSTAAFALQEIQLGGAQSCGLVGGELWCWGAGRGATPARVGGARFSQVSVGGAHSCGLSDGRALCWGANAKGQLGNNSTAPSATPTEVAGGTEWRSIAAGGRHSCGVTAAGRVLCWGENKNGQLGDGTTTDRKSPTPITGTGSTAFTQVVAGGGHTCALTAGGKAWCWGDGFAGQLGTGLTQVSSEPTEVSGRTIFISLTLGGSHSCGLTSGGQAWCWGEGRFGQLGEGSTNDRSAPVQVRTSETFADLAAGGSHTCALTRSGQPFCWGANTNGQLGDGSRTNRNRPVPVASEGTFQAIGAGEGHTCVTGGGGAQCWGDDRQGQLGDGGNTTRPTPALVTRG